MQRLRSGLLDGRLDRDEFEERIERAYAAATVDELRGLTRDLPEGHAPIARRQRLLPGNRPFAVRFHAERPAAVVISEAMRTFAADLLGLRYRLERSEPTRLVFTREQFPFWNIVAAVVIPLIGLIVLLAAGRDRSEVIVSATDLDDGGSLVDVFGVATRRVRRAMLELDR